jgi:hypothetical protein
MKRGKRGDAHPLELVLGVLTAFLADFRVVDGGL